MIVLPPSEALPLIKSNKAKALAVLSEQRLTNPEFKDLPTAKEQGYNVVWGQAWGLAGPPDMDPALVKYWDDAIQKLVATDAWKAAMKEMFLRSEVVPASKAKAHFAEMHNQHLVVLKDLGLAKEAAK